MKSFNKYLCATTLLSVLTINHAYANEAEDESSKWGVSAAVILTPAPYKDYDNDVMALPLVTYEGDRVFWRGLVQNPDHVLLGALRLILCV